MRLILSSKRFAFTIAKERGSLRSCTCLQARACLHGGCCAGLRAGTKLLHALALSIRAASLCFPVRGPALLVVAVGPSPSAVAHFASSASFLL
jgi:hypothetical protein